MIKPLRLQMRWMAGEQGFTMTAALLAIVLFSLIGLTVAAFGANHFASSRRSLAVLNALAVAEAGADDFMFNINQDRFYAGSGGEVEFYNDSVKGRGTYETTVVTGSLSNERIVESTGRIYLPANATTATASRKVRLLVRGTQPFNYALQAGTGPIYMYGNTGFSNARLYSNDFIRIQDNGVTISGEFWAANKDPASGANNCSIRGNGNTSVGAGTVLDVRYNVINNCGMNTNGATVTENNASVVPQPLPSINRATILAGISANQACNTVASSPYEIKNAHYPNNTPDSGVDPNASCVDFKLKKNEAYVLKGDAHIRGNVTIDGNTIRADDSLTTDITVLIEGTLTIKGNGATVIPNANGIAVTFVSYDPTDSNGEKTQPNALTIQDNSLSLNARFLALNGSLGFKGRGSIGPIAGKSMVLDANGTITFLQPNSIPADPDTWDVISYQQVPVN
jgi:hypothetical protein